MTDLRKAAEMALEILDMCFYDEEDEVYCLGGWHQEKFMDAREALRQALAQPVDAVNISAERVDETVKREHEWVGLTDEEIHEVVSKKWWDWEDAFDIEGFSRAIEAKLKEKNGG